MEDIYLLHLMFVFDIDNSSEQSFRQMYTNMKPSDYYVYISKHIYNPCEQSFEGYIGIKIKRKISIVANTSKI